jgi:tetratricopeptide (TPR) repeat protein
MSTFMLTLYERFGQNAYLSGNYDKAERWFRKLEAKEPESITALRNLGVILMAKGDAEGAERYLLKEEKIYGRSFNRHAALADIAYARGKRKEAQKRYSAALAEPECAPGGSAEAARPLMEKRCALCADEVTFERTRDAMKAFNEAQELRESGEYEAAIAAFRRSFELDETNWPALNNIGTIYLNTLKRGAEAAEAFEQAFRISRNAQIARNYQVAQRFLQKERRVKK